jgi:outer membrane protein assembly factor BamD
MPFDRPPRARRLALPLLILATLALSGCGLFGRGKGDDQQLQGSPAQMYREANRDMRAGNYAAAVQKYEALESRYPFTDEARQGQLDLLYSYYKNDAGESAIDQADQFVRENPTHPRVDYAYYVRGLVYFESGANWLERQFRVDTAKRPPQEARKSFQAFQVLLQQYPNSPYAADARQRMIYLRNRLADYEVAVARYYMQRGAYVGAANRARGVLENYDGAPAVDDALAIMAAAYRRLGIDDLAVTVDKVRAANVQPDDVKSRDSGEDDSWWRFWN